MQQFEVDDGGVQKKNPPETPIERVYSRMFRWGWVRWIVTTCLLGLAIAQISNSIKKQGAIFSIYNIILVRFIFPATFLVFFFSVLMTSIRLDYIFRSSDLAFLVETNLILELAARILLFLDLAV